MHFYIIGNDLKRTEMIPVSGKKYSKIAINSKILLWFECMKSSGNVFCCGWYSDDTVPDPDPLLCPLVEEEHTSTHLCHHSGIPQT
jgi:hypothetical protein